MRPRCRGCSNWLVSFLCALRGTLWTTFIAYGQQEGVSAPTSSSGLAAGDTHAAEVQEKAEQALKSGKHSEAVPLLLRCVELAKLAARSDKHALRCRLYCQAELGRLHLMGVEPDLPRNYSRARELLEESAADGLPEAQFSLAVLDASALSRTETETAEREGLVVLHLYAAATGGHQGALMAMGYRHMYGYGVPRACATAALYYIDVAKKIASIYSNGMPQAVELIRLNLHQKDRKVLSASEKNLFLQLASGGDTAVAAAIGKRYLLGIEGFAQDYGQARHYLRMAADQNHAGAIAMLGYTYSLGLGVEKNYDVAYSYFVSAAAQHDALGHNGLGFIYFRGTAAQAQNLRLAFKHFNESAHAGSSDGMFNLASMYLTGTGVEQSFQRAVLFFTQALDRGHTPAAYSLAVMHLNGVGTVRDCDIAVNLLKKVCERGPWVSRQLSTALEVAAERPDEAAHLFLRLGEAGHEVAQMNAAHLLDTGAASPLVTIAAEEEAARQPSQPSRPQADSSEDVASAAAAALAGAAAGSSATAAAKSLAQRYYELSAAQGSVSSELRLGDYAFYGWGDAASPRSDEEDFGTEDGAEGSQPALPELPVAKDDYSLELRPQAVDYEAAVARYRRASEMTVTAEWMQGFVARAAFNLGFMHQFGLGVSQDLHMARQQYLRSLEVDPGSRQAPVSMALAALSVHHMFLRFPPLPELCRRLSADVRVHVVVLELVAVIALVVLRRRFAATAPTPRLSAGSRAAAVAPTPAES